MIKSFFIIATALLGSRDLMAAPPDHLKNIKNYVDSIEVKMAYASSRNFIGRRVDGYNSNKCFVTDSTGRAIARVQAALLAHIPKYSLVVRDCWRPQRASNDFNAWTQNESNGVLLNSLTSFQRSLFLDPVLFDGQGRLWGSKLYLNNYLSYNSQHSKGNTIDLELKKENSYGHLQDADAGTGHDTFSKLSSNYERALASISIEARTNRYVLSQALRNEGFYGMMSEWWHWTHSENLPNIYYDGTVE